jgi:hypothetical protein
MKFLPGRIVATPGVREAVSEEVLSAALERHLNGDWGDVSGNDRAANERALRDGTRLLSVYHAPDKTKFYVITEANRSTTTLLLPSEY